MIETDVLVIGGGPAGSSAARFAAKGGADVIVIDKIHCNGKAGCQHQLKEISVGHAYQAVPYPLIIKMMPLLKLREQMRGLLYGA